LENGVDLHFNFVNLSFSWIHRSVLDRSDFFGHGGTHLDGKTLEEGFIIEEPTFFEAV
jgi:hypothetical protein